MVIDRIETFLFDKFPQTLNQIEVGRIGGQEEEFEAQVSGQILDKLAMLVTGIVQYDSNRQVRAGSSQLTQQSGNGVGIDGIGVGHSEQLPGGSVESTQNIETLSSSRSFDEKTGEGPQKAKEGLQNKVSRIHKKEVAFACSYLLQTGFKLCIQELLLFFWVRFGGNLTNFASFQP